MTAPIPAPVLEIARAVVAPVTEALVQAMIRYLTGVSSRLPAVLGKLPVELKSEVALRARQAREDLARGAQ